MAAPPWSGGGPDLTVAEIGVAHLDGEETLEPGGTQAGPGEEIERQRIVVEGPGQRGRQDRHIGGDGPHHLAHGVGLFS